MGGDLGLDAVGDELARRERVLHARVGHREAVAHADGVELERHAAGLADGVGDELADLAQVVVAGDDLDERVADGDERLAEVLLLESVGVEEGAVGGAFEALLDGVGVHGVTEV